MNEEERKRVEAENKAELDRYDAIKNELIAIDSEVSDILAGIAPISTGPVYQRRRAEMKQRGLAVCQQHPEICFLEFYKTKIEELVSELQRGVERFSIPKYSKEWGEIVHTSANTTEINRRQGWLSDISFRVGEWQKQIKDKKIRALQGRINGGIAFYSQPPLPSLPQYRGKSAERRRPLAGIPLDSDLEDDDEEDDSNEPYV